MEENLLVLAKTCPIVSKKYEHLVCVGGLTKNNEWRRIYPVPWELFWAGKETKFKKKQWISYTLRSPKQSDHRPESRKIVAATVKLGPKENFKKIKELLDKKLTTLEDLNKKDHHDVSLGVIKPLDVEMIEMSNEKYEALVERGSQQTLGGGSAVKIDIPKKVHGFKFRCCPSCPKPHEMFCEDWEIGELYRNCEYYRKKGKYKDEKEVFEKMKFKWQQISSLDNIYFIVGTHRRWGTYIIVGVIYPTKKDVAIC